MRNLAIRNSVLGGAPLPYDAEVEYLESTGEQYIDTGFNFGAIPLRIICRYYKSNVYTNAFGVDRGNVPREMHGHIYSTNCYLGNSIWIENVINPVRQWHTQDVTIDNNGIRLILNGIEYQKSGLNGWKGTDLNEFLFCTNNKGVVSHPLLGRLSFWQAYSQSVIIRDYIPVRFTNENGESEGAMYDRVSGQLFRNQGTGAFVIGHDKVSQLGGV